MSANILEVRDIHTSIGDFHILEGVTVNVVAGAITVLLGRNGAGKTTTLRTIMGITPPNAGSIHFDGNRINGKSSNAIAQLGIGFVPEHRAIFKELSVRENLQIAERTRGDLDRKSEMIFELFPDLKRLIDLPGGSLSGGQQQMLAVARALVPDNRLLLIDEPSEGLAPVIIDHMIKAISQLAANVSVLLVEQNFRVASKLAQYFVIIEEGRSPAHGLMSDLKQDEALIQRYLGVA